MQLTRLSLDKPGNFRCTQTRQLYRPNAETVIEEPLNERHVVDDRRLRQHALLAQVLLVCLNAPLHRRELTYRHLFRGNHLLTMEKIDEMYKCGPIPLVWSSPLISRF